jgi:hypothetical protein
MAKKPDEESGETAMGHSYSIDRASIAKQRWQRQKMAAVKEAE